MIQKIEAQRSIVTKEMRSVARGNQKAVQRDIEISETRKAFNWEKQIELSIDPEKVMPHHEEGKSGEEDVCTICGEFSAIKRVKSFKIL